jgi:hypothetical protein
MPPPDAPGQPIPAYTPASPAAPGVPIPTPLNTLEITGITAPAGLVGTLRLRRNGTFNSRPVYGGETASSPLVTYISIPLGLTGWLIAIGDDIMTTTVIPFVSSGEEATPDLVPSWTPAEGSTGTPALVLKDVTESVPAPDITPVDPGTPV